MDWVDHYKSIEAFLEGLVFWIQMLSTFGKAIVILIFSGISSKLGFLAGIGCWFWFGVS
jgi:hypothetical protein